MTFNPYSDPARIELLEILEKCHLGPGERIVFGLDEYSDQICIQIQHLSYPLGKFFKSFANWRTIRAYKAPTYERLLIAVRNNPEWLVTNTIFEGAVHQ